MGIIVSLIIPYIKGLPGTTKVIEKVTVMMLEM